MFSELTGKRITQFETVKGADGDVIHIGTGDGAQYRMWHNQDCCESVYVDDICGDVEALVGALVLDAREDTNDTDPPSHGYAESYTWTFYNLVTDKGTVTIRWFGSSNGYYSERVDFSKV